MKPSSFFVFALVLIISQTAIAQSEKLGVVQYAPPTGFAKAAKEHAVVFSKVDQASGKYCFITLYAAGPSSGE